jgi:hypothetical protein
MGVSVAALLAGQAHALLIEPTFDSTLTSQSDAAAVEAAIDTAANTIDGLYSNPGTVQVLFAYNSAVLGQSQDGESFLTMSQYSSVLTADSTAHPGNTILSTAVANLSKGNGATANYVLGTTAFLRVGLGLTGPGTTPYYNASGGTGGTGVFDGIVTIGNVSTSPGGTGQNSQAVSVLEHELNEVLGGGGTGSTIGENLSAYETGFVVGPTDLYRYHSTSSTCAGVTSTASYSTSTGEVACYSINGGTSSLVRMNQAGGGSDYGDYANTSPNVPYIQDAFYPGTTNDYSTASPEFVMMESIGYDSNLPEPSSLMLMTGAVGGLGWFRRRRARACAAAT